MRAAVLADAGLTSYRAVGHAREWLREGGTALVLGAGGLGQFAVQYLKRLTPARVVAVDLAVRKRARALEIGADEALAPRQRRRMPQARAVLDFVGSDESLALGASALERRGIYVLVGAAGGTLEFGLGTLPYPAREGAVRRHARGASDQAGPLRCA